MAECHPVGFQWVMEAKARGAKVIHVDPRFTRTSAVADLHVPLRAGSDIVFLGGIINYVLANEKYFRDYVVSYTNAATLLTEDFADTEDLDGVFSGLDREHRTLRLRDLALLRRRYVQRRRGGATGPVKMTVARTGRSGRRHAARRTVPAGPRPTPIRTGTRRSPHPGACSRCSSGTSPGTPRSWSSRSAACRRRQFAQVCELLTENSGRDRTTAFVYSVGWTQHTVGVQYIRTAAILQLLLGNIGRPGGGILALRGHASIQGSTDIPTLFDLLPGYLPMPHVHGNEDLATYVRRREHGQGLLGEHEHVPGRACSRPGGARPPPRTTISATTTCPG